MFPQSCVNLGVIDVFRLSSIVRCIVHHYLSLLDSPCRSYLFIYLSFHSLPLPFPFLPLHPFPPPSFLLTPPKAPSQSSGNKPFYLTRLYHIIPLCYSKDTPPLRLSLLLPIVCYPHTPPDSILFPSYFTLQGS